MRKNSDTEEYLHGGNLTLTMTETKYRPLESHVCLLEQTDTWFIFDLCLTLRERKGDGLNLIG